MSEEPGLVTEALQLLRKQTHDSLGMLVWAWMDDADDVRSRVRKLVTLDNLLDALGHPTEPWTEAVRHFVSSREHEPPGTRHTITSGGWP